ncbi:DUF4363 family protein [Tuberibacillus calidus]|uniref:DUF4363 family protein n=1 Tax=Tuberibacillus calidus TaxID=340097 RepID=UPI000420E7ED|nr:DUF4363 family protein [Tuberibacillus calidus]
MAWRKFFYKWLLFSLMIFGLLAEPAAAQAPKDIQWRIKNLKTSITQTDWNKAYEQAVDLRKHFDKNRWKYQLLGDEQEYEGISNDIENLKAAILARDKSMALILTYDIKEVFDQIYEM